MSWRIGKSTQKTVTAQAVAPITCRLLACTHPDWVPWRFEQSRKDLTDVAVSESDYIKEVVHLVSVFPAIDVTSKTVSALLIELSADEPKVDIAFAVKMYVLAYLTNTPNAYRMWRRNSDGIDARQTYEPMNVPVFNQLMNGLRVDREKSKRPMESILIGLLRAEMNNRCTIVRRVLDCPFYYEFAGEYVMLNLTHYEPAFVRDHRKSVLPLVRDVAALNRAEELMRNDFDLWCTVLLRIPPKTWASDRFEREVGVIPDADRVMYAFCSKWVVDAMEVFKNQWNLESQTIARLCEMAEDGWTMNMYEATASFGSRKAEWMS